MTAPDDLTAPFEQVARTERAEQDRDGSRRLPTLSKEWCLEMALREGDHEVGAGPRHDYLVHESIEALLRCPLCGETVLARTDRAEQAARELRKASAAAGEALLGLLTATTWEIAPTVREVLVRAERDVRDALASTTWLDKEGE